MTKNNLRGWHVKDVVSLIKCAIIIHNMNVKEHMSVYNFNFDVIFNEFEQPGVEDDGQLHSFGAVKVDFSYEATTFILHSILADS